MSKKYPKSKKPDEYKNHVDYEWFNKKVDGHGGSLGYSSVTGLAHIGYIGSTSRTKVFWYNILLYVKYLTRKLKK